MSLRLASARAAVASLLLSTAFLAACGGGSDTPPPPPPPAAVDATWVVTDGATALTTTQVTAFGNGGLYVNAHTSGHASGEIRGQLDSSGTVKLAALDAAQEGVTSTAFGAGVLQVDVGTGEVRGFVITSGLVNPTVAHVHLGARGVAGGPIVTLQSGGSKDLWVVPDDAPALTAAQITAFQDGALYFNVHTAANPGGELRGQIDKAGTFKLASLDGAQEGNASTHFGAGIMAVNEGTGAVAGFVVTSGLTSVNNAHVHGAARGATAGPVVPMTFGPNLSIIPDGATALTPAQVTSWLDDAMYFNVHTVAFPGGEIRGQIDKTGSVRVAVMDGAQESPAVTTTAWGAGLIGVDGTSGEVSGFITTRGLVSPTIAHVHAGVRGANGGPIVNLSGP